MGQLTGAIIVEESVGLYAAQDQTDANLIGSVLTTRALRTSLAAAGTAVNTAIASARTGYVVTGARLLNGPTAITASNSNYVTITLEWNNGAGGARTVALTAQTTIAGGTGNIAADSIATLTPTTASSANVIPAGSEIFIKVVATGSGTTTASAIEFDLVPN